VPSVDRCKDPTPSHPQHMRKHLIWTIIWRVPFVKISVRMLKWQVKCKKKDRPGCSVGVIVPNFTTSGYPVSR
jgi:hypothetical protein